MPHSLPPLPYPYDALAPTIDELTMRIHHDKHHGSYVAELNAALEGTEWADWPVEQLLSDLAGLPEDERTAVRNNAGGRANHSLFWQVMAPNTTSLHSAAPTVPQRAERAQRAVRDPSRMPVIHKIRPERSSVSQIGDGCRPPAFRRLTGGLPRLDRSGHGHEAGAAAQRCCCRTEAVTTFRPSKGCVMLIVVRRSNAGSACSFGFKPILSKRADCRSPADGGVHAGGASLSRRTSSGSAGQDRCSLMRLSHKVAPRG